ncbi:hypothetical protein ES702_01542 [subsurface metagenome]
MEKKIEDMKFIINMREIRTKARQVQNLVNSILEGDRITTNYKILETTIEEMDRIIKKWAVLVLRVCREKNEKTSKKEKIYKE